MTDSPTVKSWFKKAVRDLKSAKFLLSNSDDDILESAAFHCQQCIEKSLKGFLVSRKVRVAKTHDLLKLTQSVLAVEPDLDFLKDNEQIFETFTDYAVAYRYPDAAKELPPLKRDMVVTALSLAEKCFNELSRLSH